LVKYEKKLFSRVKYDNLTVFDWKLYSGWFEQKVDFWPRQWTIGPKLSKTRIKWFFYCENKKFCSKFFQKTVKYHVLNMRTGSYCFMVTPRNIGQLWFEWKKNWLNTKKKLFSRVKYDNLTVFDWQLYSGWFEQKVNFWPWKWTLGPKLSKKRKKWFFFVSVKIKSFVPHFFLENTQIPCSQ
jgi:hypothetical protein